MGDGAGKGLIVGGVVGIVALLLGWPFFDKAAPCGFLDVTCAFGRFLMFWVFMLLAVAAAGTGLLVIAFGAKRGSELAQSGGAAGLALGRRGTSYAYRQGRAGASRLRRTGR